MMRDHPGARAGPRPLWMLVTLLVGAALAISARPAVQAAVEADSVRPAPPRADSIAGAQLIQAEDLARALADSTSEPPEVLQVGFKVLFRSGHIPGSRFIGPASKPEGLAALRRALAKLPRTRELVLYCGCCPWRDCPNVRPALRTAQRMGFRNVHVLFIARNLQHDWIDKGLPIREGDQ
jgi:rhodanese-like protein